MAATTRPWCCAGHVKLVSEQRGVNFPASHPDWHLLLDALFVVFTQPENTRKLMMVEVSGHVEQLGKLIFQLVPNTGQVLPQTLHF